MIANLLPCRACVFLYFQKSINFSTFPPPPLIEQFKKNKLCKLNNLENFYTKKIRYNFNAIFISISNQSVILIKSLRQKKIIFFTSNFHKKRKK